MATEHPIDSPAKTALACTTKCHILVVDDEPINQQIMGAMLNRFGCTVKNAANGQLALTAASSENFDLIFMDIQMPVMDGIEATRQLRTNRAYAKNAVTPIVALSAYAIAGDNSRWLDAGMNDHLAKPVTLDSLQHILEVHLKK